MKPIIDWAALQSLLMPSMLVQGREIPNWDHIAPMYDMMAEMERVYTYNQVNCFDTDSEDTVLDIGCGPGRISCAMAERAKSVTALDLFLVMMEYCRKNATERGLNNIHTLHMDWKDAELGKNIDKHDIVIASRSVGIGDIRKLNAFAQKYVVLIAWANAPSIPPILNELFAGTNPQADDRRPPLFKEDRRVGYNATWNMVYDIGADPNIRIVTDGFTKNFDNDNAAYAWLRRLQPFDDQYLPIFQRNLEPYITHNSDGSVTFRKETRSYVLWWEPIALAE